MMHFLAMSIIFHSLYLFISLTTGRVLVGWGDYSGDKSSGSGRRQSSVGQNTESKNPWQTLINAISLNTKSRFYFSKTKESKNMSMIVVRANSSEKITHSFDSSLIIELILLMVHVSFFFGNGYNNLVIFVLPWLFWIDLIVYQINIDKFLNIFNKCWPNSWICRQ